MKIAVCIKQVPVVSLLKFDNETKRVVREGVPSEVNPFDMLAVSAVANLKQEMLIEAVVFTKTASNSLCLNVFQASEMLLQRS